MNYRDVQAGQLSRTPEVCVIGRCNFGVGIGAQTYALCEALSRYFSVCILPTEPDQRRRKKIQLPNGRIIPVCKDTASLKVSFFCDVLWNGYHDYNLDLVPKHTLKYAWVVYDSDQLPERWASELNERFDLVCVPSPHLADVLRRSRVEKPISVVPIALDLEELLAEEFEPPRLGMTRFCSVSAFHPRKNARILVEAFAEKFHDRTDANLVLHSNLDFKGTFGVLQNLVDDYKLTNVKLSLGSLTAAEKNNLIRHSDVFVNCSRGEGYSIGPREALALGKPLVLSDVGAHADLAGAPGVFMVPAATRVPARYPEIDNLIFGQQRTVDVAGMGQALEQAAAYVASTDSRKTVHHRRRLAGNFTFSALAAHYAELINSDLGRFRATREKALHVSLPEAFRGQARQRLGRSAAGLAGVRRVVTPAYDAGFFSVFNAFMSHLVWDIQEGNCHSVLPDWDVGRMIEREGTNKFTSFCYGKPSDGNVWLKIFQPLFGYTDAEMNDPEFLYLNASLPRERHNERREPLMTYVHAYKLYGSTDFLYWRRQYHRVFARHVLLQPELEAEIREFRERNLSAGFKIAAHVRHPSHAIEQPNAALVQNQAYIARVNTALKRRNIDARSGDWKLFLATDQDSAVRQFEAEFGDHVVCFRDVRRTGLEDDARFQSLSDAEKAKEGHQIQHLMAANPDNWNWRMAWEVIRDAYTLAHCDLLLHVVSNISTAVAYMNPDIELEYCSI